jgi:predicted flap endonuclease-1-like 5' DNA nuclease
MANIKDVQGIGEAYAAKLKTAGVTKVEDLLAKAGSAKGRKDLAAAAGVDEDALLTWVNHADLFRIKGVAGQYSELLEAAGVDSCAELAQRKAENLYQKILAVNGEKKLVKRPPTQGQVAGWVEQAKKLPKVVSH